MRSSTTRAAATVLACLAGGALAVGPIGTATAATHHTPTKAHSVAKPAKHKKSKPVHGLLVVDRNGNTQKVENYGTASAIVRDPNGGEHVITTQLSKSDKNKGHLVYLTRSSDNAKWKAHAVPGAIATNGGVQVEAHLSYSGQRVFIVSYQCDGIYVADAPIHAARMPVPQQVVPLDECADPPAHSDNPPVARSGTLYGRTISILVPNNAGTTWNIYSGEPTGNSTDFTMGTPLPTDFNFVPQQVAADAQYGRLVVVGTGTDGSTEGVYETYQNRYSDTWSEPVLVASLDSATTDYAVDSVQTYARHTYIGLQKPTAGKHLAHTLFLVKGQPSGQWLGSVPLPHSNGDDKDLRLIVNTDTNHLHAVWTRVTSSRKGKAGGLMHEAQDTAGWGKPIFLTKNYRDVATEITLTNSRHPIVGYNQ